jgi:hypothetical protein
MLGEGDRLGGGGWPDIVRGHPCKQSFFPQNVWNKWKEKVKTDGRLYVVTLINSPFFPKMCEVNEKKRKRQTDTQTNTTVVFIYKMA